MRERAFFGWAFLIVMIYGLMAGITAQVWAGRMDAEHLRQGDHVLAGFFWPISLPAYLGVMLVEGDDG